MTTTQALTLADFLLARIAEDEAVARRCAEAYPPPWDVSDRGHTATVRADEPNFWPVVELEQSDSLDGWLGEYVEHVARHDPARVLAECEAKREIINLHPEAVAAHLRSGARWAHDETLRRLALPYVYHPDYRDEWRS